MSQENVELVERAIAAFNQDLAAGDIGHQLRQYVDPNIEWRAREEPKTIHGDAAVLASLREWDRTMRQVTFHPRAFVDCGDSIVMVIETTAQGRASGAEVRELLTTMWTLRRGRIVRYQEFEGIDQALEAARPRE